jgi:hypothetical protein
LLLGDGLCGSGRGFRGGGCRRFFAAAAGCNGQQQGQQNQQ